MGQIGLHMSDYQTWYHKKWAVIIKIKQSQCFLSELNFKSLYFGTVLNPLQTYMKSCKKALVLHQEEVIAIGEFIWI